MEREGKTHGNSLFSHPVFYCETTRQTTRGAGSLRGAWGTLTLRRAPERRLQHLSRCLCFIRVGLSSLYGTNRTRLPAAVTAAAM